MAENNTYKTRNKTEEVKKYLYDIIRDHKSEPNYLLPSEHALCIKFNVSRITVKSALQQLQADKLIFRHQGKGSFISSDAEKILNFSKKRSLKLIGVILPDLRSYFMLNIIHGIHEYLKDTEFKMVLNCTDFSQRKESKAIQDLLDVGVVGILIYPVDKQTYNQDLLKLAMTNFPLVFIDRSLPGMKINSVMSDHYRDICKATEYLLSLGHKNIGIISPQPDGTSTLVERLEGYNNTLSKYGVPIHGYYKLTDLKNYDEQWEDKITAYFKKNSSLTAVIIFNSDLCYKTLYVLKSLNIKIPDDLSLIAYGDDYSHIEDFVNVPITSIRQNTDNIGRTAAKILVRNIDDPATIKTTEVVRIPSEFSIRSSTKAVTPET